MPARFPERRPDGSFDMLMEVGMPPSLTVHALQAWLVRWADERAAWERRWESAGTTERELVRFADDFFGAPTCEPRDRGAVVRCRVRPGSKMWRDWGAKLFQELQKEHEGVVLVGITAATEASATATKNESLRDVMFEIIVDDRVDAEIVRAACDVISEEAACDERMAERQGHSDATVFFAAMGAIFRQLEDARRSWAAFLDATAPVSAPTREAREALLRSLRSIRDDLHGQARWELVG